MKTLAVFVASLALTSTVGTVTLAAQPNTVQIALTKNGQPLSDVDVAFVAAGAGKIVAAQTSTVPNEVTFALDTATIGKNQEVTVYADECDNGKTQVWLVGPNGQPPAEQTNCRRRRLGIFWWGRSGRVTIDIETGQIDDGSHTSWGGSTVGHLFGVQFFGSGGGAFRKDSSKTCDKFSAGATSADSSSCAADSHLGTFTVGGGLFITPYFGFEVAYERLSELTVQEHASVNGGIDLQTNGFFGPTNVVEVAGVVRLPVGPITPYVKVGAMHFDVKSGSATTVRRDGDVVDSPSSTQTDSGWDPIFGAGVDLFARSPVHLYIEYLNKKMSAPQAPNHGEVDETFNVVAVGVRVGIPIP